MASQKLSTYTIQLKENSSWNNIFDAVLSLNSEQSYCIINEQGDSYIGGCYIFESIHNQTIYNIAESKFETMTVSKQNIVKFDIWDFGTGGSNYGDLPVALTADGNLIFGELINRDVSEYLLRNWDKQIEIAKSFTDVKDFTYTFPAEHLIIIVQKSDGSVWATQNDSSFTENVNIPQN